MQGDSLVLIILTIFGCSLAKEVESQCKWDVHNCGHEEIICYPNEEIYLDSKDIDTEEHNHCFVIYDEDKGEFDNYEIEAELPSLESVEGMNSGAAGVIFNYQDAMNYDFMHLQ